MMKPIYIYASRLRAFWVLFPMSLVLTLAIRFNPTSTNWLKLYPLIVFSAGAIIFTFVFLFRFISISYSEIKYIGRFTTRDSATVNEGKTLVIELLDKHRLNIQLYGNEGYNPEIKWLTNEDGENDWNNYENTVTKITIQENVERLEWNSLAWTPNLSKVYLPNSLLYMDKNVFSRNDLFGNDKKKLTVYYNGTMQEWSNILANSNGDWDGGLKEGTIINCSNGYFKLEKKNIFSSATWNEYPN